MEEMSDCVFFALTEGTVQKQSNLVPKKTNVILKFKPKFLFYGNFDWGRCSRIYQCYVSMQYARKRNRDS